MANIYANLYEKGLWDIENISPIWKQATIDELKRRGTWRGQE